MTDSPNHGPTPERTERLPRALPSETVNGMILFYPPTDGVHGEALAASSRAFGQGNYRLARQLACQVKAGSPTQAEQQFVQQILYRTEIDPLALGIGLVGLGFFSLVVWWAV